MRIKTIALLCCITGLISFLFGLYTLIPYSGAPFWYYTIIYLLNAINQISCVVFFFLFYKKVR